MSATTLLAGRVVHYHCRACRAQALDLPQGFRTTNCPGPSLAAAGGALRTIGEACDYMTNLAKQRELRTHWQRACKLILAKDDVLTVSRARELALFMDAKLDVDGTRSSGPRSRAATNT
jgi:hypothetical protein